MRNHNNNNNHADGNTYNYMPRNLNFDSDRITAWLVDKGIVKQYITSYREWRSRQTANSLLIFIYSRRTDSFTDPNRSANQRMMAPRNRVDWAAKYLHK